MSLRPQVARKEMFLLVNNNWQARSASVVGYIPEIRFQGFEQGAVPGASKFWMRVSTNNVTTRQAAHVMPEGPDNSKVPYTTFGFIMIQMFAPMSAPGSWNKGELLSELCQAMFMATETPGGVWFRNPRIIAVQNDGTFWRWNIVSDYQFEQVRDDPNEPLDDFFDDNNLSVASPNDGLAIVGNDLRVDIDSLPLAPMN